jgi:hypothetical protein
MDETYEYPASLPLRHVKDRQLNVMLPIPIVDRLQRLLWRANEAGADATLRQLLGSIVLALDCQGAQLAEWVDAYRRASVGQAALLEGDEGAVDKVIHIRAPGRGRPRRTAK